MIEDAKASLVLADGDRVLDVGCGDGYLTHEMAAMTPAGCAVGVDPSRRMISAARAARYPDSIGSVVRRRRRPPPAVRRTLRRRRVVQCTALGARTTAGPASDRVGAQTRRPCTDPGGLCGGTAEPGGGRDADLPKPQVGFTVRGVRRAVHPRLAGWLCRAGGISRPNADDVDGYRPAVGSRLPQRFCAVVCGRLHRVDRPVTGGDRGRFIEELVAAYEPVAGRAGLFRFTQMRAELNR